MDFQIWDLPGQIDYLSPSADTEHVFSGVGAVVWVIDALDNYTETLTRLMDTIVYLRPCHPHIKYSIFIHKIDCLTADLRDDTVRDITQRMSDDLYDADIEPSISYHSTSIFDCSIFEACSKVLQGLVPQLSVLECLLDTINGSCHFEKAYLFDVISKIYIASDTSSIDHKAYELCSDYINIVIDLSEMYGWQQDPALENTAEDEALQALGAQSFVGNIKGYSLYLREINRNISFIAVSKDPLNGQEKALIDYNVDTLRTTLLQILQA